MILAVLILAATPAEPEMCGAQLCDDVLLGSDDALETPPVAFPVASSYLGSAASCVAVYQVREDGSTRSDCTACDVVVDLDRAPVLGEGLAAVSRGEIEARIRRHVSGLTYAPEHAGRWGRTYFDFILEGDDTSKIPDRPEPARCPIPDIQPDTGH